jgi:hypothetical protein
MGLLDDAIRDHLELKRRRGADPAEVAREQREALDIDPEPVAEFEPGGIANDVVQPEAVVGDANAEQAAGAESVAGETAELDMRTVLGEEDDAAGAAARSTPGEAAAEEDSLEWELPDRTRTGPPETNAAHDEDEAADDVLEETPDFLRDTPEHERMWFEQRPPRDFDFDK